MSIKNNLAQLIKKTPLEHQEKTFQEIKKSTQESEFSKKYDFPETIQELKHAKITTPEELHQIIQAIKKQELPLNYFSTKKEHELIALATSSGSQGKAKEIPISNYRIQKMNAEMALWLITNLKDSIRMLTGKSLVYTAIPTKDDEGPIRITNISGLQAINAPLQKRLSLPREVWEIKNKEERQLETAYHSLLNKNTTHIGFPTAIVAINAWEETKQLSPEVIKLMKKRGHTKRAKEIEKHKDTLLIDEVLKPFRISTYKSDTNIPDLNTYLERYFKEPHKQKIVEPGVNLSECRITVGIPGKGNPGIPAYNAYCYLFEEIQNPKNKKLLHELEPEQKYKVLVLTNFGLWNTEDIFQVTNKYTHPLLRGEIPILNFKNKDKYVNFADEHLHYDDLNEAIQKAKQKTGIKKLNYFLTPNKNETQKRYKFIIEEQNLQREKYAELLREIEKNLLRSLTYTEIRSRGVLGPPILDIIQEGGITTHIKKQSQINPQYKHKPVQNNPSFQEFNTKRTYYLDREEAKKILQEKLKEYKNQGLIKQTN